MTPFQGLAFEHAFVLWLTVPWLVGWGLFYGLQRHTVDWVGANVSPRFRHNLTVYTRRSLRWHMWLLLAMGLLLVVAGARPTLSGRAEAVPEGGRVLLVLDGSASMNANDVESANPGEAEPKNRFEQAREIAEGLVANLEGYQFALVTYSGVTTLRLPVTGDRALLDEALRTVEIHNFYQNTGSDLGKALDMVFHFVDDRYKDLQVVLLSDGELVPSALTYDDPVTALGDQEIPVHSVAVGSLAGQTRLIYDFNDVVAEKEEPAVLREYLTRREEVHLRRISRRTDGRFAVASGDMTSDDVVDTIVHAIESRPVRASRVEQEESAIDLSLWPLLVFLILFLFDALVLGRHRKPGGFEFDVERLGEASDRVRESPILPARRPGAAALAALLLVVACDSPLWWAYQENERGIARDLVGLYDGARPHYERSIGYRIRPEIPTYNLARSLTLQEDFSAAHKLYQEALQLDPELADAYFNDGVTLFRWGEAERDPRGCELERTLDLWRQALRRFDTADEMAEDGSPLKEGALANYQALEQKIEEVEEVIAHPPAECEAPPESPDPPQGGGGGSGGGGGQGDPLQDEENPSGSPPSSPPPGSGPEPPPQGPSGAGSEPPPPAGGGPGTPPPAGGGALSDSELEQIRQELARIAQQGMEPGKYHRRTLPEQFGKESWSKPEPEIWW